MLNLQRVVVVVAIFSVALMSRSVQSLLLRSYSKTIRSFRSAPPLRDTGHQAPSSSSAPPMSEADALIIKNFQEHQASAKRLTFAEEVRTLIDNSLCYG